MTKFCVCYQIADFLHQSIYRFFGKFWHSFLSLEVCILVDSNQNATCLATLLLYILLKMKMTQAWCPSEMQILPGPRHRTHMKKPLWIIILVSFIIVFLICAYMYPPQSSGACYIFLLEVVRSLRTGFRLLLLENLLMKRLLLMLLFEKFWTHLLYHHKLQR